MKKVAIVGVGLIGGSFGLALRKAGFTGEILGVSSPGALEAGMEIGAISRPAALDDAATECDLIYLAQPVDRILETLPKLAGVVRPGTLVTDAGSTKAAVVERAVEVLPRGQFVGGHPIAGKEVGGAAAADADLFRDRPYVLTPTSDSEPLKEFRSLLNSIRAITIEIEAMEHDRVLALTSHLPQLASTALAAMLFQEDERNENVSKIHGSGLEDMTRLALSSAELWAGIVQTNFAPIEAAIDLYITQLYRMKMAAKVGKLTHVFEEAQRFADKVRKPSR